MPENNKKKKITILFPTFNELENIKEIINQTFNYVRELTHYDFEILIIDNNSDDGTQEEIEQLAKQNKKLKIIINSRNFGPINSPTYGLLQSDSDATIVLPADFQHPLSLIPEYIKKWEQGNDVVLGKKTSSKENYLLYKIRSFYYKFLNNISNVKPEENTNGEGLFDKKVIKILKKINDPYPYFRGLIFELGFKTCILEYKQNSRQKGWSKNNFFSLIDFFMLGMVKHSKLPLRIMSLAGFFFSFLFFFISILFLILKLIYWNKFEFGLAPLMIGLFFMFSLVILILGVLGEYVIVLLAHIRNMPLVVEKKRINFDND